MVRRTVSQYIQAGVAALHLEDQVQAKRCGHLLNKELVEEDEYISRIRAAALTRESLSGDIIIIARTDALQSLGYEVARDRLKAAIAAGADVAFLEGVADKQQGRKICQDLAPAPVLFNCVPGGLSPELSVEEAKELGFRIIIYPGLFLAPIVASAMEAAATLKSQGRPLDSKALAGKGGTLRTLFETVGLKECVAFDAACGGTSYNKGV